MYKTQLYAHLYGSNTFTKKRTDWEPDERAIIDPEGFRINTWVNTLLGTEKEQEREREMIGIQTNGQSAIPRDSASTHGKTHCKRERLRKSERREFSECCD